MHVKKRRLAESTNSSDEFQLRSEPKTAAESFALLAFEVGSYQCVLLAALMRRYGGLIHGRPTQGTKQAMVTDIIITRIL